MKQINLSKSAQSVQDALSQKGLAFEVVELSSSTRTANDAAATIGCEVAQIFIDEDLLKFEKLWAAAGTPNAVFSLSSTDLESLTGGKIVAIK